MVSFRANEFQTLLGCVHSSIINARDAFISLFSLLMTVD